MLVHASLFVIHIFCHDPNFGTRPKLKHDKKKQARKVTWDSKIFSPVWRMQKKIITNVWKFLEWKINISQLSTHIYTCLLVGSQNIQRINFVTWVKF